MKNAEMGRIENVETVTDEKRKTATDKKSVKIGRIKTYEYMLKCIGVQKAKLFL